MEEKKLSPVQKKLSPAQKILLGCLYGLLVIMVIFSFLALGNQGQEGYQRCLEKRCSLVGQEQCQKLREVSSCCLGAGGKVGVHDNRYVCVFKPEKFRLPFLTG